MIPSFDTDDNLPAGIHLTDLATFSVVFGISAHRTRLINGLAAAIVLLRQAGCQRIFIDGSFVTRKTVPNDYDVAWELSGVDLPLLKRVEPLFFDFANFRAAQKAKFYGEFFPASTSADRAGRTFLEFFQIDKNTGNPKGIVALDL